MCLQPGSGVTLKYILWGMEGGVCGERTGGPPKKRGADVVAVPGLYLSRTAGMYDGAM